MVEQIQTNSFAELDAIEASLTQPQEIPATPVEAVTTPVKEEAVITTTTQEENPFAELDAIEASLVQKENPFAELDAIEAGLTTPTQYDSNKYNTAEKIRYGIDKQNTFFGNLYRVAKAGTQAAFDPEKEFKDYIVANAYEEKRDLRARYGELASGAYDNDTTVQAAAMATMMVDPFYLGAYMTPWGRVASASMKGIATISGVTVGLDKMLDNLATTGEIRPGEVAIAAGSATILGPLSVKAIRGISSLLPSANVAQIEKIVKVIEGKKAKDLGITIPEFKKLQLIAGDKDILEINKQLQIAGKNWLKPIADSTKLFNTAEKRIQSQIKKIEASRTQANKSSFTYKDKYLKEVKALLAKKEKTLEETTRLFNEEQKLLWNNISKNSKAVVDLTAKRDFTMLKKLKESQGLTKNLTQAVISATVRPAMGAGVGYAFGRLWGEDDADLNTWMTVGASLGGLNKLVQRSGVVFATGEKNFVEKLIFRESTKLAWQKVRELTASTTSTKLKAMGGETEKIGSRLFQELDSATSKFSASAVADDIKQTYTNRAFQLIGGTTPEQQSAAIRIVRGSKEKGTKEVNTLATKIKTFLDDFREEYTSVGIGLRKDVFDKSGKVKDTKRIDPIKDYFPRVWKWDEIEKDPKKFQEVLTGIFKSQGKKKPEDSAKSFYNSLSKSNDQGFYNKEAIDELVNTLTAGSSKGFTKPIIRELPLSEHITQARVLKGPYAKVEKVLEQNGYLVNDIPSILNNLVGTSANSIGFAKNFGAKGELLKPYIEKIVSKYSNEVNGSALAAKEISLVMKSIDGFFNRYGQVRQGIVKSGAGILSTMANLNMLDRVTVASLGDLVQPFTNSSNFTSFFRGLVKTALTAEGETGMARNMGYAQSKEVQKALLKTLTPLDNATTATNVMGNPGIVRKTNELAFKAMGLQWLTGFARRYAYNTASIDAFISSKKLAMYVSKNKSLSSSEGLRLIDDVGKYGINTSDALKLGKLANYEVASTSKLGKNILNSAGMIGSNRDALIPQVSNRLLFTQSRDPLVRLMGQFMSWTLAKSAQTNKLLQRIENGDTRQLVKLLAALPVYGGIQSLREIAKYGEIQTDLETQKDKWFSEGVRLSGVGGTLPELVIGRLAGPGARQPFYLFAPFFSILNSMGDVVKETYKGNTDKAQKIVMEKIAPFPTWTGWIRKLFPEKDFTTPINSKEFNRLKFSTGDLVEDPDTAMLRDAIKQVDNPVNNENAAGRIDSNLIDTQVEEELTKETPNASPFMIGASPVTHLRKYLKTKELKDKPIDTQMDKLIAPKEKPIDMQVKSLLSDKYNKVGELTGEVSSAGKPIYLTPEGEKVSEKSITINYNNKWLNVPSIHEGYRVDENTVKELLDKNLINPTSTHKTLDEAKKVAKERSPNLISKEKEIEVDDAVIKDERFLNYMKKVENNALAKGVKSKLRHKSPEGGTDTVGFGHKLTEEEAKTNIVYGYDLKKLTMPQAEDIFKKDLKKTHTQLTTQYGDKYKQLDDRRKQMLIDFQFNVRNFKNEAVFPSFKKSLFKGDEKGMEKEYKRGFYTKDKVFKSLARNKDFANQFFK
jgi:hypothetical protein